MGFWMYVLSAAEDKIIDQEKKKRHFREGNTDYRLINASHS